ncbi:MAG: hypothetical protein SOV73_03905 [Candidatus Faecivivens sp.]|nr:hypothetical protein [Candidatus Faecivivens sp.]
MKLFTIHSPERKFAAAVLASALLLTGCSQAGETDSDVEEIRGPAVSAQTSLTPEEAFTRAETFLQNAASGTFRASLMSDELQEIDGLSVYTILVETGEGDEAIAFEPALAVDPESGVLYSYYPDGTLTPASEDSIWNNISTQESLTPEQQQNLAQAAQYASQISEDGTADFVLTLKTGQYAYADSQALYIGYNGEIQQTLFHDGNEGIVPDASTLLARDMNFDGYEDILLCASSGNVNTYYYLWLYDPAEGNFVAYPGFEQYSAPTPNADTQQITTYERGSAIDYTQASYVWDDTGSLVRAGEYKVESDGSGNVNVTYQESEGDSENSFTVTEEEYAAASELMSGSLIDFCISRYGSSEQRSFIFEGIETVSDVSCYSIMMTESGVGKVRLYVDARKTYMVMLDEDCDGTPEETVNIND